MARLSEVPFESLDAELRSLMHAYDKELGGSGFVQVLAHTPEVFKSFMGFYLPLVSETRASIDMRITELARIKVAERNDCHL